MGGIGLRGAATFVAGGMLALAVTAPAAAHEVSSSHDTFLVAEAGWGSLDPETAVGDQAVVALQQLAPGEWDLAYERIITHAIACDMGTKTKADDEPGVAGTFAFGDGFASSVRFDARRLRWARASGTIEVLVFEVNTCDESFDQVGDDTVEVALDLTAVGRTTRTHERMRWVDPDVSMEHAMVHMASRTSKGTATVDGRVHTVSTSGGIIGRVRSSDHFVSR
jgi:hypothetical protein